jgi:ADP-heptose:LPS heptosyltransferase
MKLIPENIKSITVVKLDHIGDVILATPAIESLRTGYPEAKIRVVVGSWSKGVLANNPNVDEVICYDPPWLDRSLACRMSEKREENKEAMKLLLGIRYDLIVDLRRNDFNHIAFSASLANEHLVAYKTKSEFDHLITHGVFVTNKDHVTDQQIKLLKCLGLKTSKKPKLYPLDEDEAWAESQLCSEKPKVAVFTGAGVPLKKWPEGKFLKLGHRLHNLGFEVVMVGGQQEDTFGKIMHGQVKALNLCGKTSLLQLASVLKRVNLLVSNDSAPVHVASAVGTPVVVITKPNARVEFAPIGDGNSTVCRNRCNWGFNCPGFVFNPKSSVPKKCRCINSVSVEEVECAVYELICSSL